MMCKHNIMMLSPLLGKVCQGADRRRHYNPEEPRDWHGRWTDGGGTASAQGNVVKNLPEKMKAAIDGKKQIGESDQCVALVKALAPEVGPASGWQEGPPILGDGKPPLEPGTAIATFKDGRYPNKSKGNHAAIFLEYAEKDGKQGIWVFDQSTQQEPRRTFKPFGGHAEYYSVIKRRGGGK